MTTTQINLETVAAKLRETFDTFNGWYFEFKNDCLLLICNRIVVGEIDSYGNVDGIDDEFKGLLEYYLSVIL